MRFETNKKEIEWNKKYELARNYYNHYGNLEISQKFKTVNGYDYDENGIKLGAWLSLQREAYKGKGAYKLNEKQIELLKQIGMIFISDKKDKELQQEEITPENIEIKKKEFQNRFYYSLSNYDNKSLPTKEELNKNFIEELDTGKTK